MSQTDKSTNPAEPEEAPPGFVSGSPHSEGMPDAAGAPDSAGLEVDPEASRRIERVVADYVGSLTGMTVGSGEYLRAIDAIGHLGERDFVATAAMSGRLLDRRFRAMSGILTARAPMARQLADLRKAAAALDPATIRLSGRRSPGDALEEINRYFERFARSEPRLEALVGSLAEGRLALEQDNAAIVTEQASLATEMETLRQYAVLAARIDEELTGRIDDIALDDADRAGALRVDVLPVLRRRRRDILTQLAIVTQGYASLRVVEETNAEVIQAVASAITTTSAALRTAVMVAGAAASQRMAIEQLEAARQAASELAGQAAGLESGIAGPGGRVAMLQQAWAEVYAALDRVDAQKAAALRTISSADRELTRLKGVSADGSQGPANGE